MLDAVRTNCHISDAQHARDMTLCTYLLEMRELYRWERGIALGVADAASGGRRLDGAAGGAVVVAGGTRRMCRCRFDALSVDPFDVESANRALVGHHLVYGAGIGRFGKPQFFLASLEREEWRDGVRVLVAGREHARDLSAAPAASRGGTIYVRMESLQRWLWERPKRGWASAATARCDLRSTATVSPTRQTRRSEGWRRRKRRR